MEERKYTTIEEQIEYGLETINSNETVEIKLKDLILIFETFEEFNRFFHQPRHYPTLEDVNEFLGDVDSGAYHMISKIYYDILSNYVPKAIMENWAKKMTRLITLILRIITNQKTRISF